MKNIRLCLCGSFSGRRALEDIEIPELDNHDDVESSNAGWVAGGFMRNANVMPQEWLLQFVTQKHDQTTVERLQLNPDNTGRWVVDLGSDEIAVLVVSGRTRMITEPADYWYIITTSLPEELFYILSLSNGF